MNEGRKDQNCTAPASAIGYIRPLLSAVAKVTQTASSAVSLQYTVLVKTKRMTTITKLSLHTVLAAYEGVLGSALRPRLSCQTISTTLNSVCGASLHPLVFLLCTSPCDHHNDIALLLKDHAPKVIRCHHQWSCKHGHRRHTCM